MMKNTIVAFILLLTSFSFAQKKDYYVKKGAAVEGYDVVSYFKNKPLKGSKEYVTTYDGVEFRFASKENLSLFKKSPKKYIPQYGGWCAYALGKNNEKYAIDPETYEIKDDKLYLFYNAWGVNTLTKWKEENTEELRKKANKNWSELK